MSFIIRLQIINMLNRFNKNKKARTSFREMRSSISVSYPVAQTVYVNEVRRARRDATKRSAHCNALLFIMSYKSFSKKEGGY